MLDACYNDAPPPALPPWRVDPGDDSVHDIAILRSTSAGRYGYSTKGGQHSYFACVAFALRALPARGALTLERLHFAVTPMMHALFHGRTEPSSDVRMARPFTFARAAPRALPPGAAWAAHRFECAAAGCKRRRALPFSAEGFAVHRRACDLVTDARRCSAHASARYDAARAAAHAARCARDAHIEWWKVLSDAEWRAAEHARRATASACAVCENALAAAPVYDFIDPYGRRSSWRNVCAQAHASVAAAEAAATAARHCAIEASLAREASARNSFSHEAAALSATAAEDCAYAALEDAIENVADARANLAESDAIHDAAARRVRAEARDFDPSGSDEEGAAHAGRRKRRRLHG
jgi:hypothetical protein